MGQSEKLKQRILTVPTDLTYDEVKRFLYNLGYKEFNKGKTSGSRVLFYRESDKATIMLHKPHPTRILRTYAIEQMIETLKNRGDLNE